MVRRNTGNRLIAETYGRISGINFDPVEKKPLYHFFPGRIILSIGSVGCNMNCKCCQNWKISQTSADDYAWDQIMTPADILKLAVSRKDNLGLAYTYNEPSVWFEYMFDLAKQIHPSGMKNVMVSNGYICREPLNLLLPYMDAFSIDLKGFSNEFYVKFAGARLDPVLQTLQAIRKSGKHLEITNLIIPDWNDDPVVFGSLTRWIADHLGQDTVLHLSRYHPAHELHATSTPAATIQRLYEIARKYLHYVYPGNIILHDYQDTHCMRCRQVVISRKGYRTEIKSLSGTGACLNCGNSIMVC
jgi:pyruvate formate lyase activating enzyme